MPVVQLVQEEGWRTRCCGYYLGLGVNRPQERGKNSANRGSGKALCQGRMKDRALEVSGGKEKERSSMGLLVRLCCAWPGVGEQEEELEAKRSAARATVGVWKCPWLGIQTQLNWAICWDIRLCGCWSWLSMQRLGGTGYAFLTGRVICLGGIPDAPAHVVVYFSGPAGTAMKDMLGFTTQSVVGV